MTHHGVSSKDAVEHAMIHRVAAEYWGFNLNVTPATLDSEREGMARSRDPGSVIAVLFLQREDTSR